MAREVRMRSASKRRFFVLAAALSLVSACSDVGPRVYTAEPYDPEGGCLGEYEAIGLVEADSLSASCEPVCLEWSGTLYVSTLCAPYPDLATQLSPEEDADCAAALLADACE